jgi:hypothetical protein
MSKPNKIKVIRKLCDTQLNFNTGFIDNDQMVTVGIASTTFLSANCFCMYGRSKLGDNISANIMTLGGPGCYSNAGSGAHYYESHRDGHFHSGGGAAAAGSGGNFIATKINNFNDSTSWCVKNLGVGNTNSIICNVGVDAYVLANAGSNASNGCNGSPCNPPGAAGQAGITTSLSNTFTSSSIYSSDTCCVQGCPGTSCNCCIGPGPDFLGCGGHSGFQNSNCCTVGVLTSFYTERFQGNAGNCRGGWIHVNSTGRDDKVL